MIARHRQGAALDHDTFGLQGDVEQGMPLLIAQIDRAHIGLRVEPIGHHAPIGDPAHKGLNLGVIGAANRQPIKGNVRHEIKKPLTQRIETAPMFHMFGVDIGDHRNRGRQAVECAVGLVRLDHHPFALPHARVRSIGMDDPAIDDRGIKPARIQQLRHHRRGRGLAMGAGNSDIGFQPHQLAQHFGAPHHRQAARARGIEFRIARLDRG